MHYNIKYYNLIIRRMNYIMSYVHQRKKNGTIFVWRRYESRSHVSPKHLQKKYSLQKLK